MSSRKKMTTAASGLGLAVLAVCLLVWGSARSAAPPAGAGAPAAGKGSLLAFKGPLLDGETFDFTEVNSRRRLVVCLFDPTGQGTPWAIRAAQRLHAERHEHNLRVVGVAIPPALWASASQRAAMAQAGQAAIAAATRSYLKGRGATFPCLVDFQGKVTQFYSSAVRNTNRDWLTALYMFPQNAQGSAGAAATTIEARLSAEAPDFLYRRALKYYDIEPPADVEPLAGDYPLAPDAEMADTTGKRHRISNYRGRVLVLVFWTTTCPMCKDQFAFLETMLRQYGKADGANKSSLAVLAVCTDAMGDKLKAFVKSRTFSFPVADDPSWSVRGAFRYRGSVPDTFLIAPDGTVRYRHRDHDATLDPVLHMEIRKLLLGEKKVEPLRGPTQYSAARGCRVCHEKQYNDWALTRHACAWETLVRIGKEKDPECIRCHVLGFGTPGGFAHPDEKIMMGGHLQKKRTAYLADVQCESCHGSYGCPDYTLRPKAEKVPETTCRRCHDAKHSPRFDFAKAQPLTVHDRAAKLAKMPRKERTEYLKKLCSGSGRQLFDPKVPYIGTAACGKCHPIDLQALRDSRHTRAVNLLAAPAPSLSRVPAHKHGVTGIDKPECLRCHTTGFGQPGGFPAAAPAGAARHAMAGVGCEACHGPGKAHADDPKKPGAIAKLGGTCDACSILPICRQCHDDKNSPRFNYTEALKRAKHATGKAVTPTP